VTHSNSSYRKEDHVAFIELGGVEDNCLSPQLAGQMVDLFSEIAWDEEVRVVVMEFDGDIAPSDDLDEVDAASAVEAVAGIRQPVIGVIRGNGLGLGLELAMACDIRVGTEGACFGLPQILDGKIPSAGGTQRLPRLIGRGMALDMIITGRRLDAAHAMSLGPVHRLFAADELTDRASAMGREMAGKSPIAVSYVKEALHKGMDLTLDQGLRMELDLYLLLFTTDDRVEGVTAFGEKRKPKFKGK